MLKVREFRPEEFNGIGKFQRGFSSRTLVQHVRGHAGHAVLAGRIGGAACPHDQVHLHERNFMLLDDPDCQAIGQADFCTGGSFNARGATGLGGVERSGFCATPVMPIAAMNAIGGDVLEGSASLLGRRNDGQLHPSALRKISVDRGADIVGTQER